MGINSPQNPHDGIGRPPRSWRENLSGAEAMLILVCALLVCGVVSAIVISIR